MSGYQQVLATAGRQQQAGKWDYVAALEPIPEVVRMEEIMHQFVVCGRFTAQCHYLPLLDQESAGLTVMAKALVIFFQYDVEAYPVSAEDLYWQQSPKLLDYGFLNRALRLEETGNIDAALDIIYDQIDWHLKAQKFYDVDQILQNIDVAGYSADLLLALLTSTLPARSSLSYRSKFFFDVEAVIKKRGQWEDGLLVGLEN